MIAGLHRDSLDQGQELFIAEEQTILGTPFIGLVSLAGFSGTEIHRRIA
jgi:hypothetical protein